MVDSPYIASVLYIIGVLHRHQVGLRVLAELPRDSLFMRSKTNRRNTTLLHSNVKLK